MTAIRLHDTRSGALRDLVPGPGGRVGIYACGPTVYGRVHVGNARPFVVFSLLKRFLEHEGHDVTLVVNITDVNDKIYDAARPLGGAGAARAAPPAGRAAPGWRARAPPRSSPATTPGTRARRARAGRTPSRWPPSRSTGSST